MADLNYHHLRYFHVVAHEGHLTRAAEKLNVSQSALSSQIRQLEDRLGQKLFDRRGRSLILTEAGRIALDHADSIFTTGRELLNTLKQTGMARRPLRVGAISTLSRNFQLSFLKPALGRKDVEIILRSGSSAELIPALTALQLDVVLTNQPPDADALSDFVVQAVDTQPVGLICTPDLCPKHHSIQELISTVPLILPAYSSVMRMHFDALCDRLDVTPQIAAEVEDMAMMRLLAREGAGLAVIPSIVVKDEIVSGRLIEAHVLPDILETFYAVTVRRKFPNPVLSLVC
ncbi:LysR family transcriptional regulator [Thalassospira lucentensis]|uniref:LysR family transcriptional regulator n=1 Tax=Thalassospira lucentensis TaxID=168935 RepID=UPI00142E91CA|nr:LysR family transcriptional regulator [Thalassospira lucentensis]NIZ03958.1 LysR family transcriptional regulator [Thalassospira lucentensis]